MPKDRRLYVGPILRRLRRDRGMTQAEVAADLRISASYLALLESNTRPLTADLLVRLAQIYNVEARVLAGTAGADEAQRLQAVLKDPIFSGIERIGVEAADVATQYPGVAEALLRLYATYRQEQVALADRGATQAGDLAGGSEDPVVEAQHFLAAHRNSFPVLDDAAERIARGGNDHAALVGYLKTRHNLRTRRVPATFLVGSTRRLDRHHDELLLDDSLDAASQTFQLALQLAYLEMGGEIDAVLAGGDFASENGRRLSRRALGSYAAAALLMPYSAFARMAEARRYDVEALARHFGASFEQTAHRLTTLQKPGHEKVPFFFIRVDPAGNVSKRLDGAGFPFARHGGGCPLWSVHHAFRTPREIVTQWLELPDGQRFFSIARTVTAGGGAFGAPRVERAIALGCAAEHAGKLIYTQDQPDLGAEGATPIGVTCHLCQRTECTARSAPPTGRQILSDDVRRTSLPFGFSDS